MMENEGEQSETTTQQQIEQQEVVNENEAGQQDNANGNGRSNSDEEEPIKADPNATDEQSKFQNDSHLLPHSTVLYLALSFSTTPSRMPRIKSITLIISLQLTQLQMPPQANRRLSTLPKRRSLMKLILTLPIIHSFYQVQQQSVQSHLLTSDKIMTMPPRLLGISTKILC